MNATRVSVLKAYPSSRGGLHSCRKRHPQGKRLRGGWFNSSILTSLCLAKEQQQHQPQTEENGQENRGRTSFTFEISTCLDGRHSELQQQPHREKSDRRWCWTGGTKTNRMEGCRHETACHKSNRPLTSHPYNAGRSDVQVCRRQGYLSQG